MDIATGLFIFLGLGLLLVPLDYTSVLFFGPSDGLKVSSYYSLVLLGIGGVLLGIGLLSYHKKNLQYLFLRACQDIEQTGLGRGVGNSLAEAFRPVLYNHGGSLESQSSGLIPLSSALL